VASDWMPPREAITDGPSLNHAGNMVRRENVELRGIGLNRPR